MGKHLLDQDIVAKDGDCLGENGVVVVEGRGDDSFVENGVGQDIDKEDLPLGNRESEEVDGNFVGRGVQNT